MFNIPNTLITVFVTTSINRYKNCYFLLFEMLQQASTCLKPTKETTTLCIQRWRLWTDFTHCSAVFIADFEQVNADWDVLFLGVVACLTKDDNQLMLNEISSSYDNKYEFIYWQIQNQISSHIKIYKSWAILKYILPTYQSFLINWNIKNNSIYSYEKLFSVTKINKYVSFESWKNWILKM